MKQRTEETRYTLGEEIANSVTHGIGTVLAITGMIVLILVASRQGDAWRIISCSVFGTTLILSYLSSTLYHSIPQVRTKQLLRSLDHAAIYLLIAGTYTPFMLVNLRGPWGWSIFGAVWGIAVLGVIMKTTFFGKIRSFSTVIYLVMGWIALIAIKPMISALDPEGIKLLVMGGLTYSAGVIFYAWKKLPYNHAIWHLFVLAGSGFHFFAILYYVVP